MSENEAPRTAAGRRIDAAFRAAYERGDRSASWQDAREWILAIEAEAAAPGPALTTADVARALIESDLIPRYMEYARLSPSMNPAETIEHIAATWAPFVLRALPASGPALTRSEVRRVVTNAYYDARNEGETMETAADRAADAVMVLAPAAPRGNLAAKLDEPTGQGDR